MESLLNDGMHIASPFMIAVYFIILLVYLIGASGQFVSLFMIVYSIYFTLNGLLLLFTNFCKQLPIHHKSFHDSLTPSLHAELFPSSFAP